MKKFIEFETNLQVASFEEAMARACANENPEQAFAQGVYPMPPYLPLNNPPAAHEYQWWYLQRAKLFNDGAGPGGAIKIGNFAEAETFATASPTHTLSNGGSYMISLSGAVDWENLSPAAQALFPEDAPEEP